jgi:hypothetical protein
VLFKDRDPIPLRKLPADPNLILDALLPWTELPDLTLVK